MERDFLEDETTQSVAAWNWRYGPIKDEVISDDMKERVEHSVDFTLQTYRWANTIRKIVMDIACGELVCKCKVDGGGEKRYKKYGEKKNKEKNDEAAVETKKKERNKKTDGWTSVLDTSLADTSTTTVPTVAPAHAAASPHHPTVTTSETNAIAAADDGWTVVPVRSKSPTAAIGRRQKTSGQWRKK